MSEPLVARDGLLARKAGAWAKEKLQFLDDFVPGALSATGRKHDRVFIDLFAGPGVNVIESTGEEFPGSPLRIARLTAPRRPDLHFTRAIFCNNDLAIHRALQARVDRLRASGESVVPVMDCLHVDSNSALPAVMASIDPYAYILAFADIEGVAQLPWVTLTALRARHQSVDLYVLVPVDMSFNRLLGTDPAQRRKHTPVLDAYFGDERWRAIGEKWMTDAQGKQVRTELLDLYRARLGTLWAHAEVVVVGRFGGDRNLYRMIFASNHGAGTRIAQWCAARPADGQMRLL